MTWNIQNDFLSRQKLGTAGTIARSINAPITEKAIASGILKPAQGVILKQVGNKLIAIATTSANESFQTQGVVMLKPNSVPTTAGDIEYASGEMVDILVTGFIYVKVPDGSTINPIDGAVPDTSGNAEEWIKFVRVDLEQRIKPIYFLHPTELDSDTLGSVDVDTQIIYVPDRALDNAVDDSGAVIAN